MLPLVLNFFLLSGLIVAAGILLTRFADRLADLTSIGHSLAGLLLLAAATSLPELSIGWAAVRIDAVDLTIGELLGSCLWNLLLLAILDLGVRSRGQMLSRQSAVHALAATVSILLVAIAAAGFVLPSDTVLFRVSPVSWGIIGAYILCIRLIYQDHRTVRSPERPSPEPPSTDEGPETDRTQVVWAVGGYLLSAGIIFVVAPKLAVVADELADVTGIGDTFIGASLVALMTSLPEAVTTLAAIRLGQMNMAVANIFGSNAFNLVILGVVDFATPYSLYAIASNVHLVTAIAVIIVTAVALLGLLYRAEKKYWLIEPDAWLVIVLVLGALGLVYRVTT